MQQTSDGASHVRQHPLQIPNFWSNSISALKPLPSPFSFRKTLGGRSCARGWRWPTGACIRPCVSIGCVFGHVGEVPRESVCGGRSLCASPAAGKLATAMSSAPKRVTNVIIRIGLRRLCANPFVRDRSIEILRFSEASNWASLSGDLRGTMMLERCCAVPGKNLPDTEKWLCSYCFVWRGLASMAQPVRPAAQALPQVALTGSRR